MFNIKGYTQIIKYNKNKGFTQNIKKNTGVLTVLGDYNEDVLKNFSIHYKVPLIIISSKIYLPGKECLDVRKIGGDTENRKLGGDTENRKLGGDTENRKLGGDTENRKLGGDTENRKLGGDTENRKLGGDTEKRKLGGDTENRKLGGDTENRKLGGDTSVLKCKKLEKERGFEILHANPNATIKVYYQKQIHIVKNLQVKY
ncbi:hypothetical protein [Polaribacter gochangensis]|uniref:hypothetical protein n=1 Tax=Polaribacter gochangensis TaxID=3252903 RepID=UPI003904CAB4